MNNKVIAKSYVSEAKIRLDTAKTALKKEHFAYTVRQSQECVELSLKAALRYTGIEPPKWHDVGIVLKENESRFPAWFRKEIPGIASHSRNLAKERGASFYGDEEMGIPAEKIFSEWDARESLKWAKKTWEVAVRLIVNSEPD
jgi:HEPN domain-containing protein